MSYLGALLAQARGDAPSLLPVLPARFEPDIPMEFDAEIEAPTVSAGPVASAPPSIGAATPASRSSPPVPLVDATTSVVVPRSPNVPAGTEQSPSTPIPPDLTAVSADPVRRTATRNRTDVHSERPREMTSDSTRTRTRVARRPVADQPVRSVRPEPPAIGSEPAAQPPTVRSIVALGPAVVVPTEATVREPTRRDERPGIRVSIGRVDLRMPPAPVVRPPAAPWRPHLSLDDYLRERSR
jgi:hypothetical protein